MRNGLKNCCGDFMQHQDYETVILTKKKEKEHIQKDDKKQQYIKNEEIPKQITYNHPLVCHLKVDIQKARLACKKTQIGLANELNIPKDTINKIESGIADYDPNLLSKLETKLNTRFTRPKKNQLKQNYAIQTE